MNTALCVRQRHGDDARCELLWGQPREVLPVSEGSILVFEPGAIVAYVLHARRRRHAYIFRSLDVDDPLAASLPGVRPRVMLLLDTVSAGRVRLVRGLFAYLAKTGSDPSALPDAFYIRVSAALSGRLPRQKILVSLLNAAVGSSRVGSGRQEVRGEPTHNAARSPTVWTSGAEAWLAAFDPDPGGR